MAGVHQLWAYDPEGSTVGVAAGTTNEGLVDGPGAEAWFAQPSGLAATADRLWLADSETSALRWVDLDGTVHTAVGTGLFDFGHRDGAAEQALFQHPLGYDGPPRRLGRGQRHLQPRTAPLRPRDGRRDHAGDRREGAQRRGSRRGRHRAGGVGATPADPAAASRGGRAGGSRRPTAPSARRPRSLRRAPAGRRLRGPDGPEAGHALRALDPGRPCPRPRPNRCSR